MQQKRLSELFAPKFYEVYEKVRNSLITHFFLKGGRGSTKSTFVAMCILLCMMFDASKGEIVHCCVIRRVDNTLRASVHAQFMKAAAILGVDVYWTPGFSPLTYTYKKKSSGASITIQFHGVDDPVKLKSITPAKGYFKYIWVEEAAEFDNMEHIRSVLQSLMRGGEIYKVFYTFNPPKDVTHWANVECEIPSKDRFVHHSTYLDVVASHPKWLGNQFVAEAESLKERNYPAYEHEYLGIATGVEGQIFGNIEIRELSGKEIKAFEKVSCGLDWGFSIDPLAVIWVAYDQKRRTLYLFDEIYKQSMSNAATAREILEVKKWRGRVICDNAEPKSIADINGMGVKALPCRKGKGSVHRGIRWLSAEIDKIVVDPNRCPNAVKELKSYAYEKDAGGKYKREYPDKDNHIIDALRYATQDWQTVTRIH